MTMINLQNNTCRICLQNIAINNIFLTPKNLNITWLQMMMNVLSMKIKDDDNLPKELCEECCDKLITANNFKILAEQSHIQLIRYFIVAQNHSLEDKIENGTINNELKMAKCSRVNLRAGSPEHIGDDVLDSVIYKSDDSLKSAETIKTSTDESENKTLKVDIKTPIMCDLCGKLVNNITAHKLTHKPKKKYPCNNCHKVFNDSASRMRHNNVHHLGKLYFCQICQKHFKYGKEHIRVVHTKRPLLHECVICGKSFPTRQQLSKHKEVHEEARPYTCNICNKMLKSQSILNSHRRNVHENERTKVCQYCSKSFFSSAGLKTHLRSHTKEKVYKCTECGKNIASLSWFKKHKLIHSGIKNVKCELCPKMFIDKGRLKLHMISHTKERTHPCKYCGVKFGRTHHRDRHQKTAHENKLK